MSEDVWDELNRFGRSRRYGTGDRVLLEGGERGSVMLIHRGHVRIAATTEEGVEVTLAVRGPGDVIGDHSALTGGTRSAGVVALGSVELTIVSSNQYLDVLERHPGELLDQLRRTLRALADADERLVEMTALRVPARVVRRLIHLADVGEDEGSAVVIPMSQEEFAAMCGASRGAVAVVLAELRDRGIVSTARRRIRVEDLPALQALEPSSLWGDTAER